MFWPAGYGWNSAINRSLLEKILRQLCSVFIFGQNVKEEEHTIRIEVTQDVEDVVLRSIKHLPVSDLEKDRIREERISCQLNGNSLNSQIFKKIPVEEFCRFNLSSTIGT